MKFIIFIAFLASAAYMTSAKKLLVVGGLNGAGLVTGLNGGLVTGLNGGLVTGLNPGLVTGLNGGLLGQGLVVGGLNPGLLPAGGAVIGQSPFAQVLPGKSPFMIQNPMAAAPFGVPNPQVPMAPQPAVAFPNMGFPFLAPQNPALRQILPPQQQAAGGMNPMGNGQQPQGDMPAGPVPRFRRTLLRRMQAKSANTNSEVTPTPTISSTLMN